MYNTKPDRLWFEMRACYVQGGKLTVGSPFLYRVTGPDHRHRCSEPQLRTLCSANRLSVLSVEAYGGANEVLLDLTGKLLASRKLASKIHSGLALAPEPPHRAAHFGQHFCGHFLGYCLIAQKPEDASQRDLR